jgi:hypothetical protein
MANLEFAYAAPSRVTLPASVTKALPRQEWHVTSCKLDAIEHLTTPPDFMWVDFGKAPKLAFAQSVLTHLAGLQESRPEHPFFFISGSALPEAAHEALVQRIYATFHDPSNVVADLVGQPDLSAAIAKFLAQRKARATRLAPVVAAAFTPVVAVATIVTLPTLARRFFVTGLRKFFRRCIPARPGLAEVECGQQALRQLIGGFAHAADPSDRSENDKPALRQSI